MKKLLTSPKTERPARMYLLIISIFGWLYTGSQLIHIEGGFDPWIYTILLIFLAVCELFPVPVWKGFTTLSFPIVYALYIMVGLPLALVSYALVILIVNIIDRRPFRIVSFNPAQLVISFSLAVFLSDSFLFYFNNENILLTQIIKLFVILFFFYMINNIFIDLVLLLRPQKYPFQLWKQKLLSEINSGMISFAYGCLFFILGSQNRGQIDMFSFFFFFSPLVAIALFSSVIARLKIERNRLNALVSLTTTLNKLMPTKEWIEALKSSFHELIDVEALVLWTTENGRWKISYKDGKVYSISLLSDEVVDLFEQMKKPLIIFDSHKEMVPANEYFGKELRSFVFSPLVVDNETVGILAVARSRTKSFNNGEIQSIATLANQLAVIIKTRILILDKEKRSLLEERNRIARDIHDGIAQTLAGALMKLETAQRKWERSPEESMFLVKDSMEKLRGSLKQVRQSIYALRPNPTERVGLHTAIQQEIKVFEQETGLSFSYEQRGKIQQLSSMVEKILFETFQECVQNIIKHAQATKVEILLSYQKESIILKVKDDGIGFSLLEAMLKAQKEPHFGILHMNDAAEKIDSSLQIDSKPGKGTEIIMTVPKMGIEGEIDHDQAYVSG
ncbi:MAG TPA: GAF domain-containing sensor histidine kinase [Bacillus sp. (in: firmicutes)]|uniref:GAF domain-containing sensor histidine kinase n=1 Tax=Bacillus litorisediminis TaxID=2922713 RepID=UPI001FAF0C19|nr:GAF domain-containing sensor histidine kinase [Bacillus litorisediminis]HWO75113.1 GAF domain-containing sensor histidine kinase [Bacillus sp. (in: firmicutes)]